MGEGGVGVRVTYVLKEEQEKTTPTGTRVTRFRVRPNKGKGRTKTLTTLPEIADRPSRTEWRRGRWHRRWRLPPYSLCWVPVQSRVRVLVPWSLKGTVDLCPVLSMSNPSSIPTAQVSGVSTSNFFFFCESHKSNETEETRKWKREFKHLVQGHVLKLLFFLSFCPSPPPSFPRISSSFGRVSTVSTYTIVSPSLYVDMGVYCPSLFKSLTIGPVPFQ